MIELDLYSQKGLSGENQVFNYLIDTLRGSIIQWDYFVDWEKVLSETRKHSDALNLWDRLVLAEDFDRSFIALVKEFPFLLSTIPLMVVRDGASKLKLEVMVSPTELQLPNTIFDFSKTDPDENEILNSLMFVKQSGLIKLFQEHGVQHFRDYLLGVEAGLNSNARKNRGGKAMEAVVEAHLETLSKELGLQFLTQVHPSTLSEQLGIRLPETKASRIHDFVLKSPTQIALMEVNFYGGGGSKLKSTAGEYKEFQQSLRNSGLPVKFIWVTDGPGWALTKPPLRDAFTELDYLLNLQSLTNGALKEIMEI